jgi:hypothetical protein
MKMDIFIKKENYGLKSKNYLLSLTSALRSRLVKSFYFRALALNLSQFIPIYTDRIIMGRPC